MTFDTIDTIKHRALPAPIVRAIELAFSPLLCLDLCMNARRVLSGILTHIRYDDPKHHIYPLHETLVKSCKLNSLATLRRGIKKLEDKGYLTREQVRALTRKSKLCTGLFHMSHIRLTEKALDMIGLMRKGVITYPTKKVIHIPPVSELRARNKENTPELKETVNKTSEPRLSDIDPETRLPRPLLPLLTLGIEKKGIYQLMGLCKGKSFRLEDVTKACWQNVMAATSPLAYLVKMIGLGKDFKFIANAQVAEEGRTETAKEYRQVEIEFAKRHGWIAINDDGDWLGTIESGWRDGMDPGACVAHIRWAGTCGSEPINRGFLASVRDRMQRGELRFVQP